MFSYLFKNLNIVDLPFIYAKVNLFFFLNVQVFKNKFSNHIMFFIENLSALKFKTLKVFYLKKSFESFFFIYLKYILLLITLLLIFI